MLCQNCKRNDAGVHLKRIINGEAAEIHLCSSCAASLGVSDMLTGFSPLGDILGNILSSGETRRISNKILSCETCGLTFEDIVKTGSIGCPDCYRAFTGKLRPVLVKLHGRAVYKGRVPDSGKEEAIVKNRIEDLRVQLERAVAEQNFELAAVLRDEIRALSEKEGV